MVAITQVTLTCDVCGNAQGVQTRMLGLGGQTYEIDLCAKDSKGLSKMAAGYVSKARRPANRGNTRRSAQQKARSGPEKARGAPQKARAGQAKRRSAGQAPKRTASSTTAQPESGVFVYGIFPADIEVAAGMPGVGETPGLMRAVHDGDLAALVSDVRLSGQLGSPADRRIHRKTLDASARGVPVLALPFGTVLSSDEAVAEQLAAHGDEFAQALRRLDGRAQFVVQGRYTEQAGPASRQQDTRALQEAMAGHCVASNVREPADEQDAVDVAYLVDIDQQREVRRVVDDLARQWDGRIQLQLLGPMAAYDFVPTMDEERWIGQRSTG